LAGPKLFREIQRGVSVEDTKKRDGGKNRHRFPDPLRIL